MRSLKTLNRVAAPGLLLLFACGGDGGNGGTPAEPVPNRGTVQVEIATTGVDLDLDGYVLFSQRTQLNTSRSAELSRGTGSVLLEDVAGNCTVAGDNPRSVDVPGGGTVTVRFDIGCAAIQPLGDEIVAYVAGWVNAVQGGEGLRVIAPDGAITRQLTAARDRHPAISPDGKRIVFIRPGEGSEWNLHIVNADGTDEPGALADRDAYIGWPDWSPDGRQIVFYAPTQGTGPPFDLYVLNLDDLSTTRLTTSAASDTDPAWSPDGSRIAFAEERGGHIGISVIALVDGSVTALTTPDAGADFCPAWSPDGTRIAFMSSRETGSARYRIYVMNADGSGLARVTPMDDAFGEFCPAWSPDGGMIVFERQPTRVDRVPEDDPELFTVRPDGTDLKPLTDNYGTQEVEPDWRR